VRLRPQVSLTLGAGLQGAVHCRFEHAGQFLPFAPGSPGGTFWQVREGKGEAQMEEVTDEPLYRDRVCGIDIGKAGMVATIRVPSDKDRSRRAQETRSFGTTKREVLALADWLRCWQVPAVVMEATGDYWKGPFYRLEAEGFECVLADAKQVKNLPGRPKRDPSDSRWLAACFERGAVTACFVATPEFRIIRLHTRYRRELTEERTREKQRTEKLLESAAIKLSSVVSDLHGVTGRDIMDHLIAGVRDPKALAQLARARARRKIAELEEALEGTEFFTAEHAALLTVMLALRQPIRSASTVAGTPPSTSKHSASRPSVVAAFSSAANRTNRNRDQASTAQNTCRRPSEPQSMASVSPCVHTAGRRPR
jgi:Transposase